MKKLLLFLWILFLSLILFSGCRQRPKEVELEKKKDLAPLKKRRKPSPTAPVSRSPARRVTPPAKKLILPKKRKINLNTASSKELQKLHRIGPKTAKKIIAHRPYYNIEAITEVPGIGPKTYEKLKDLITVGKVSPRPKRKIAGKTPSGRININAASRKELETLPGIGTVTARAIIAHRPYKKIKDITRVPRIGPKSYEKLKDRIAVGSISLTEKLEVAEEQPPGKINLNTASQKELETLPGIGPKTAIRIMEYRPYRRISDIQDVPRIGPKSYEKLKGLITVKKVTPTRELKPEVVSQTQPTPLTAGKYRVTPLVNREYYFNLHKALQKAEKSILVAMYVMETGKGPSDPPRVLLNALIKAHKRGVKIEVLLERPKSTGYSIYKTNFEACELLRSQGIKVTFDSARRDTHTKLVVIDDRVIFSGNHNWTTAALLFNNELSLMVETPSPDPQYRKCFQQIPR